MKKTKIKKPKTMISEKKRKNITYSILFIAFSSLVLGLSAFLMYKSIDLTEEQETLTSKRESSCKAFAVSQEYMLEEEGQNIIFSKTNLDPNEYMYHIIEMKSVLLNCSNFELKNVCIGSGCESESESDDEDKENTLTNENINLLLTLEKG